MLLSDYRIYKIKRHGKVRTIMEPKPELKAMQKKILHWLCDRGIGASKYAHGFVRGRSIITAVRPHIGKNVVLMLDIHDFFPSVDYRKVYFALKKEGIDEHTVKKILRYCIVENERREHLPQGAPTSPFLANLVFKRTDFTLAKRCRTWLRNRYAWHRNDNGSFYPSYQPLTNFTINYTRYADDLIFSSDYRRINHMLPVIERIIWGEGFHLNRRKTRYLRKSNRQEALGLIINRKLNVPREYWRNLRAELHQVELAVNQGIIPEPERLISIMGKISWILSVNKKRGIQLLAKLNQIKEAIEKPGRHFGLVRDEQELALSGQKAHRYLGF